MAMDSHSSRNNGVRPGSINSQGGGGRLRGVAYASRHISISGKWSIEKGAKGSGVEEWRRQPDWR